MTGSTPRPASFPLVKDILGNDAGKALISDLGDGLRAHVVPRPGTGLNVSTHRRVYRALVPVTTDSFAADMTPYWRQRSQEGYLERLHEFVLVEDDTGAMVGWTGFHLLPHDEHTIIYIDSTGMVRGHQSRGVMRRLMRERIHGCDAVRSGDGRPVYLTARSESPVFYRLMGGLISDPGNLFPHPTAEPPAEVIACAEDLAEWLGQRDLLAPSGLALEGAYGTLDELYDELPSTGDPVLDRLFRDRLGPLDAYLLVAPLR